MFKPTREYFIKDGVVMQNLHFDPSLTKSRNIVYEVIRVIKGKPLFIDEHIERMQQSGLNDVAGKEKVLETIEKLIHANSDEDGNILLCILIIKGKSHLFGWYIQHNYPSKEDYINGVNVMTMNAVRRNPNAKIWNAQLRKRADHLKASSGVYEVLLIDNNKHITEGSKSNIFFIRGNTVFTAAQNKVLQGITRQKVILLCNSLQLAVREQEIPLNDLPLFESAFITGTSPKILPVSMIDKIRYNTFNSIMQKLMIAFDALINIS